MASSTSGRCCVCNIATMKRCGPCGAAGVTIAFCSTEHQKLVHFAHKQVCGKNAKPFRFPPLSKEEMDDAVLHNFDELQYQYAPNKSGPEKGKEGRVMRADELKRFVEGFEQDPYPFDLFDRAAILCMIRQARLSRLLGAPVPSEYDEEALTKRVEVFMDPILVVSAVFATFARRLSREKPPLEEDWLVRLVHQCLVLAALQKQYKVVPLAILHAASGPVRDILHEVAGRDRELAEAIRRGLVILNGLNGRNIPYDWSF